jgi:hypothetical protein
MNEREVLIAALIEFGAAASATAVGAGKHVMLKPATALAEILLERGLEVGPPPRPWVCPHCGKRFTHAGAASHLRWHEKQERNNGGTP